MSSVDTSIGQGGTFAQGPASPVQPPGMGITTVPTFLAPPANLSAAFTSGTVVALASFPPAGPIDGQQVILELPSTYDPVGGKKIRWAFAYNGADAVWDFIGGASLYAQVLAAESTASMVYTDLGTVGPAIALPRPGDYQVGIGFDGSQAAIFTYATYSGAGITASDANAAKAGASVGGSPDFTTVFALREQAGLTTATSVTAKYRTDGGAARTFANRTLVVAPLRIT